jgi:hypothetical protein
MTYPIPASARLIGDLTVTDDTPIFVEGRRELLPGTDRTALSRFADPTWQTTPAVLDVNVPRSSIHWSIYPADLVEGCKCYTFAFFNTVEDPPRFNYGKAEVVQVQSFLSDLSSFRLFLRWLEARDIFTFGQVTADDLDDYLFYVREQEEWRDDFKRKALLPVQRLHLYSELLPPQHRLPGDEI